MNHAQKARRAERRAKYLIGHFRLRGYRWRDFPVGAEKPSWESGNSYYTVDIYDYRLDDDGDKRLMEIASARYATLDQAHTAFLWALMRHPTVKLFETYPVDDAEDDEEKGRFWTRTLSEVFKLPAFLVKDQPVLPVCEVPTTALALSEDAQESIAQRRAEQAKIEKREQRRQRQLALAEQPTGQTERRRPRKPTSHVRAISLRDRARIMERDGFKCRRCGAGPRTSLLVVDHIVPVVAGGTSEDENLQTLCEPCNMGKRSNPPHEHDLRVSA